jgi:hypothetical protein
VHEDLLLQGLQDGAGDTDLQLQGLQARARAADQDLLLQSLQDGAGDTDLLLQGLQARARAADQNLLLYRVQAGLLPEDHQVLEVRAEVRALHGHSVRAPLRVQAGAGLRLLPVPMLPKEVWMQLRAELRLRQLTGSSVKPSLLQGNKSWSNETHKAGRLQSSRPAFFC